MTTADPVAVLIATQNLNAVLRVMQWAVIVLIFLFFLRVIRAVWVEMSPATVRKPRSVRRQERRDQRAVSKPVEAAASPAGGVRCISRWSSLPITPVGPTTSTTS